MINRPPQESRDSLVKHGLVALVAAVLVYAVAFFVVEHLRTRRGGWQLTFQSDNEGHLQLVVAQPKLKIADVRFTFVKTSGPPSTPSRSIIFNSPITNVPFGRVVYLDTTFLPGSIVLDLFNHQIQLLPRVLFVDRQEIPWQSGAEYRLP